MNICRFCNVAACFLALASASGWADDGALDTQFAGSGKLRIPFDDPSGTKADHAYAVTIQPNGMALVLGSVASETSTLVGLARVQTNGVLDPSFNGDSNTDGKIVFGFLGSSEPRGLALLSDGRIVVAAEVEGGIALLTRRSANGDNDDQFPGTVFGLAFAIPGATNTEFVALLGVAGGKFLAAGTFTTIAGGNDYFVARFTSDGVLDSGFGSQSGYTRIGFDLDGTKNDKAVALALAPDGRIAVVGTVSEGDNEIGVAMLQSNGTPDNSFDGDGKAVVNFDIGLVSDDRAKGACFAPDGTLFVVGTVTESLAGSAAGIALLSKTGSLVNGFGNANGRRIITFFDTTVAAGAACTRDGKFLLTGTVNISDPALAPSEAFVARYLGNGSYDNTFGSTLGTAFFGINVALNGRSDRGVAIAQDAGGRIYSLFDAEYLDPDYDLALARLTVDPIFADDFE
jgi:uncharacterized delta-60 repeat protein